MGTLVAAIEQNAENQVRALLESNCSPNDIDQQVECNLQKASFSNTHFL
jgi:hypothetical protein